MKSQLNLNLEVEEHEEIQKVRELYEKDYDIQVREGNRLFFVLLKDDQEVVEGKCFYYILTKKEVSNDRKRNHLKNN